MNQGRILPLVGPSVVLYLVAEVVASAPALDVGALVVCAAAFGLATVPFWGLRDSADVAGAGSVSALGVAAGIGLVRWARPDLSSLVLDLASCVGAAAAGVLLVTLALTTPDTPQSLARGRRPLLVVSYLVAGLGLVVSLLGIAPAFELGGETQVFPARWSHAASLVVLAALALASVLRLSRRRLGSTPEALAAGGWARIGVAAALLIGAAVAGLATAGALSLSSELARALMVAAALFMVLGHVAMLASRRPVRAGEHVRRLLAVLVTVVVVFGAGALLAPHLLASQPDALTLGAVAALTFAGGGIVHRGLGALAGRLLMPYRGRLLDGATAAIEASLGATSIEELGATVLPPLRTASADLEGQPVLFVLDPPREVRIDAAALAHVEARELSPALLSYLIERPGEVVLAAPLRERVVRRPELRGVVEALEALEAICVVPLAVDQVLEGVLAVPRGQRVSPITLEELDALEHLGRHVASQLALLASQERARLRTRDAVVDRDRVGEQLEEAKDELGRLRADARSLKAGGAQERFTEPAIAYSDSMRALGQEVLQRAPLDSPVLLVGEADAGLDRIAHRIHAASGRREGPFVVAECASVRPERSGAALFGESDGSAPGWLRLAEGGTLLLLDAPALALASQAELAEALATRRATLADGSGSYAVDARVVITSRLALAPLVEAGVFDAELSKRLSPSTLQVPALRERAEDIPSLVLLALDRECRVLGRPVIGMEPAALEQLQAHDWPGNLRELTSVVARAVAAADGPTVRVEDLPPLAPSAEVDPFEGSYAAIEQRVLERALERADGNKSEAARALGLKRTTFLDKLRRHGLGQSVRPPPPA